MSDQPSPHDAAQVAHTQETDSDQIATGSPPAGPTITELVQAHRDRTGDSYATIAMRARPAGVELHIPYLQRVGVGDIKDFPKNPDTIVGLAHAMNLTPREVVLGYARQRGLDVGVCRFADRLPAYVDEIPPAVQDALLALMRTMAREHVDPPKRSPKGLPRFTADDLSKPGVHPGGRDDDGPGTISSQP